MMISINKNWRFYLGDAPEAFQRDFDDKSWRAVTLPHDWSVEGPFSKEYSSGTGYLQGGTAWYRGRFFVPEKLKGKKLWVVFDGVYKNSQVWCNSYYLGKRASGYATFRYDLTDFIKFGEENVLSVKVAHEDISDSRWFTGSGIYRKVSLDIQDPLYFDEYGIIFGAKMQNNRTASITVKNHVVNETEEEASFTVVNCLMDQKEPLLRMELAMRLAPREKAVVVTKGILKNPKLWSADSPELYRLKSHIETDTGSYNEQVSKVGICEMRFDADEGFFVGGKSEKLRGVCVHHDAGCLGAAVHPNVWRRRLQKLKAMGCNAIRMSHNPHMPELYDLCDEMGFYVIDEAFDEWEGCKNKWTLGHNVYPPKHQGYAEDFPQWYEEDLRMLVRRGRNHPSILMWSIGNEIDYPNDPYCHPRFDTMTGNNDKNKPQSEKQYNPGKPNMQRLSKIAEKLAKIVRDEDETRPVTAAAAFPELSTYLGFIDPLDVVGYNYKEEFYAEDHKRFPDKPFLGSECVKSFAAWKAVRDNTYISGQFLWTGIDFLGEAYGWPVHGSGAGHLTLAGYEKSEYWYRQALWSENPVCNLVTARVNDGSMQTYEYDGRFERMWNYAGGEEVEVRCFTNNGVAELFMNGKSCGEKHTDDETGFCSWIVLYEAGEIRAVGVRAECKLETTGAPVALQLSCFEDDITADGESIAQIEIRVVDNAGRVVPTDSSMLYPTVEGAELIGIENGDLSDNLAYSERYRRAYRGRAILYIRSKKAGTATVRVRADFLKEAVFSIEMIDSKESDTLID